MSYAVYNKKRLFTEAEYAAADPVERIYMHLLQPDELQLNKYDAQRLDYLKTAFAIACEEASGFERIRKFMAASGLSERQSQQYLLDAITLFGDVLKVNKDLEKAVIREKLIKLAQLAHEKGDYETELKCWTQITKLYGLDKPDPADKPKKARFTEVIFTNNPRVLKIEAENAEYEEGDLLE